MSVDIVGGYDMVGYAKGGHQGPSAWEMMRAGKSGGGQPPSWLRRSSQVLEGLPGGSTLVDSSAGTPRKLSLGISPFNFTIVPVVAAGSIAMVAQIPMRLERVTWVSTLSPSLARFLPIVGVMPQTATAEPLPIQAFRETAFDMGMMGNTLNVGQTLTMQVSQLVNAVETIFGVVVGTALQQ